MNAPWPLPLSTPESRGFCPERLARVDAVMDGLVSDGSIAGGITAVARGGALVQKASYGFLDLERQIPMREDALFRIYSMTKPITTVAALMLYEEGAFFLDDPLEEHLPALARARVKVTGEGGTEELVEPRRPITIHDAMTHTAGFTYDLVHEAPANGWDLAEFVEAFADVPLIHQPGTQWSYSASQDVLGRLIEVVSGQPLDAFFRERICAPLGMVDTDFHVPADKQERLATLYDLSEDRRLTPAEARPGGRDYLSEPRFF